MSLHLDWDGLTNARDLGGWPTTNGNLTVSRAFVRSEHPSALTEQGWRQMYNYGVRTIVSLTTGGLSVTDDLRMNRPVSAPQNMPDIQLRVEPIEDGSDSDFMDRWAATGLWGTPLYFSDSLRRWPALYANVLNSLAAGQGTTLFHCGRGHDRTGITALLLLANAEVTADAIAADYLESSAPRAGQDLEGRLRLIDAVAGTGTTVENSIADTVASLDADFWSSGLVAPEVRETLRSKLTGARTR